MSVTEQASTPSSIRAHGMALLDSDTSAWGYEDDPQFPAAVDEPFSADELPPATSPAITGETGRTAAEPDDDAALPDPAADGVAPPTAPTVLTLTEAELAARIEDATKRARGDQSATAQHLADSRREIKRLQLEVQARELALGKLYQTADPDANPNARYLTKTDILEEQQRLRNYVASQQQEEETGAVRAQEQAAQLVGMKEQVAARHFGETMQSLLEVGVPAGFNRESIKATLQSLLDKDEGAQDFLAEFNNATTAQEADRASKRLYRELNRLGTTVIHTALAEKTREENPPKSRPQRTQTHGSSGAIGIDPLRDQPLGTRGRNRINAAWDAAYTKAEN